MKDDLFNDLFTEYSPYTYTQQDRLAHAWMTGAGLQAIDGLQTSFFYRKTAAENIAGRISLEEAVKKIAGHSAGSPEEDTGRDQKADLTAARAAGILYQDPFEFSARQVSEIHAKLFEGIYDHAGKPRDHDITRQERVLNGGSVTYGCAGDLTETLDRVIRSEKGYNYAAANIRESVPHMASFIADLWQIHPFREGNTMTAAVFFIKYCRFLGFPVMNAVFAENALYFRGALARANYEDRNRGIRGTTVYLERFLNNLLAEEHNSLENRDLFIR